MMTSCWVCIQGNIYGIDSLTASGTRVSRRHLADILIVTCAALQLEIYLQGLFVEIHQSHRDGG